MSGVGGSGISKPTCNARVAGSMKKGRGSEGLKKVFYWRHGLIGPRMGKITVEPKKGMDALLWRV